MILNIKDIQEGDIVSFSYENKRVKYFVKRAECISKRKNTVMLAIFYSKTQYMTQIWNTLSNLINILDIQSPNKIKQTKKFFKIKGI